MSKPKLPEQEDGRDKPFADPRYHAGSIANCLDAHANEGRSLAQAAAEIVEGDYHPEDVRSQMLEIASKLGVSRQDLMQDLSYLARGEGELSQSAAQLLQKSRRAR